MIKVLSCLLSLSPFVLAVFGFPSLSSSPTDAKPVIGQPIDLIQLPLSNRSQSTNVQDSHSDCEGRISKLLIDWTPNGRTNASEFCRLIVGLFPLIPNLNDKLQVIQDVLRPPMMRSDNEYLREKRSVDSESNHSHQSIGRKHPKHVNIDRLIRGSRSIHDRLREQCRQMRKLMTKQPRNSALKDAYERICDENESPSVSELQAMLKESRQSGNRQLTRILEQIVSLSGREKAGAYLNTRDTEMAAVETTFEPSALKRQDDDDDRHDNSDDNSGEEEANDRETKMEEDEGEESDAKSDKKSEKDSDTDDDDSDDSSSDDSSSDESSGEENKRIKRKSSSKRLKKRKSKKKKSSLASKYKWSGDSSNGEDDDDDDDDESDDDASDFEPYVKKGKNKRPLGYDESEEDSVESDDTYDQTTGRGKYDMTTETVQERILRELDLPIRIGPASRYK